MQTVPMMAYLLTLDMSSLLAMLEVSLAKAQEVVVSLTIFC